MYVCECTTDSVYPGLLVTENGPCFTSSHLKFHEKMYSEPVYKEPLHVHVHVA